MRVMLPARLRPIKNGIEARSEELALAGHGRTAGEAVESLRRGVVAWCHGLQRRGELEPALERRRVRWERNGELVAVEIEPVDA